MPSSISSSSERLPHLNWPMLLVGGLAALFVYILATETLLASRGIEMTVQDGLARWINERSRARELGRKALVLVGASRVQLGIDTQILREATGLEPVQLAIDGSSFIPVFKGLAEDPRITGTVLVGIQFHLIGSTRSDTSYTYQRAFERGMDFRSFSYKVPESKLGMWVQDKLRNYANGARPWDSLMNRVLTPSSTRQYLVTYPDRSRAADYSLVTMPEFYFRRVLRNLGEEVHFPKGATDAEVEKILSDRVSARKPKDNRVYLEALADLMSSARKIEDRGGRVFFIVMPMSGLVRELDERMFPRELFWQPFVKASSVKTIHFADYPQLAEFNCPDGSHLDREDRESFTRRLAEIIVPGR